MKKKIINIFLILVMLISIFPISIVNAESSVNRIGSSKVKSMVIAYTGGNSQIYVNKITKQDGTVVRYVYSRNFIVNPSAIAKLKSVLATEYSSLIPDDYTRDDNVGIKVCSDSSLVDSMNENWTSSEWVGRNVVAIREIKNVTNEDGDGINQTAISNAQSYTVLFNEIKNNAEVGNREIWEEREAIMKEAWDEAEAAKQEDDPTYIPQEYVGSEYVPLDFEEITASDIENTKTLEENQIELSVGTSLDRGYDFINGKLVENIRVESVNHVASIYSSHTIIDDSESITKINSLNISIENPRVGDTATETTKPTVTLDSNPNYEIDHIAYVTAYPSEKPVGEYDAPFAGTFEKNKDYVVEVSLKAKDGFAFSGNEGMTLKVNGKDTDFEMSQYNADGSTYYMFYAKVKATTPTYEVIEGANQTYTLGSNKDVVIKASGDKDKITAIEIDNGNPIDSKHYELTTGSTILTLKSTFLEASSVGEHTITFKYNDGEVSTKLSIVKSDEETPIEQEEPITPDTPTTNTNESEEKTDNPQTGDNIMLYISMLGFSIIGIVGSVLYLKKKSFN